MAVLQDLVVMKERQGVLEIYLKNDSDFNLLQASLVKKMEAAGASFVGPKGIEVIGKLSMEEETLLGEMLEERFEVRKIDFRHEPLRLAPVSSGHLSKGEPNRERRSVQKGAKANTIFSAVKNNVFSARDRSSLLKNYSAPLKRESFKDAQEGPSITINSTLRNGQRLEYDGHIILIGDVNTGAEIVATGNIIVWGALRGLAHAGSGGDEDAFVLAWKLLPQQLRIATSIAIAPKNQKSAGVPEKAIIENKEIVVIPLTSKLR